MLRKWLDRLLGRSSDLEPADEAQAESAIERQRLDRAAGRVMGVGGDYGGTPPEARTPRIADRTTKARAMFESEDEIRELQGLIDRTFAHANPHLARIVKPERRLNARQVVRYLQGTKHVAFATVNERGEPRVAPLDGVFIRGRFTVSTGGRAARLRHLRANPACSAAHVDGDTIGIVVHGHATIIGRDDEGVEEIEPIWSDIYGSSPFEWGEGVVFMRIEPSSMWAYAFHPENFPE